MPNSKVYESSLHCRWMNLLIPDTLKSTPAYIFDQSIRKITLWLCFLLEPCMIHSNGFRKPLTLEKIHMVQKHMKRCSVALFIMKMPNKTKGLGLSWWSSGEESACQCRRHKCDPWFRKIPRAVEQISPCATTTKPACCSYWNSMCPRAGVPQQKKPL